MQKLTESRGSSDRRSIEERYRGRIEVGLMRRLAEAHPELTEEQIQQVMASGAPDSH